MSHTITEERITAGQAIYTKFLLKLYNIWVLSFSNHWIWRCPKHYQLEQYNQNITNNHLDIGVGTGYYLKHSNWSENTSLSLMDLNPNCLAAAKEAISNLSPVIHTADIYKPQEALTEQFDSISMNYLLHCLPGNMKAKNTAIANAASMLKPYGVLFGATILSDKNRQTPVSRRLARFYNQKGIFSNKNDSFAELKQVLQKHLENVEIKLIGCVALFKGYKP